MDLSGDVEDGKRMNVIVQVMSEETSFILGEIGVPASQPRRKERADTGRRPRCRSRGEALISRRVREVIPKSHPNVGRSLNNGRTEILVAVDDQEVVLAAEVLEGPALMGEKIRSDLPLASKGANCRLEGVDTARNSLGKGKEMVGGIPLRANVHPGIVHVVAGGGRGGGRVVSSIVRTNECFDAKVVFKARERLVGEGAPGKAPARIRNELEAQAKEGPKIVRRALRGG